MIATSIFCLEISIPIKYFCSIVKLFASTRSALTKSLIIGPQPEFLFCPFTLRNKGQNLCIGLYALCTEWFPLFLVEVNYSLKLLESKLKVELRFKEINKGLLLFKKFRKYRNDMLCRYSWIILNSWKLKTKLLTK